MSRDSSTSPSEGEIVESGSEKATTTTNGFHGTDVDRPTRAQPSISPSPSPLRFPRSPGSHAHSRDGSRSPYHEPRISKRATKDDHYDRDRNDPRRFKVSYEEPSRRVTASGRSLYRSSDPRDRRHRNYPDLRDQDFRQRPERRRERSPRSSREYKESFQPTRTKHSRNNDSSRRVEKARGPYRSHRTPPYEQSVSDRGQSPNGNAIPQKQAESAKSQTYRDSKDGLASPSRSAKCVHCLALLTVSDHKRCSHLLGSQAPADDVDPAFNIIQKDEATLIEERRKRREAIKAKHKGQATAVQLQLLALENQYTPSTPKEIISDTLQAHGKQATVKCSTSTNLLCAATPKESPPDTPKQDGGQDSPTDFVIVEDADLANNNALPVEEEQEDGPSAADYDPTLDMQEDKKRHDEHQRAEEVSAAGFDEKQQADQDVLIPETTAAEPPAEKAESKGADGYDMFADDVDMVAAGPSGPQMDKAGPKKAVPVRAANAIDMSMLDDWDDTDGYYKVILGELLDGRYHVQSNLGKGMFSGVVRATDKNTERLVAIKIIRNNDTMKKAGFKEIELLQQLNSHDLEDKKHLIRLERTFEHKLHLCMVFENLSLNLREVLKKFGRDVGINLKAVRAYAQQMFLGLSLLRKCNILHADIKPDNILVNDSRNMLKICDLGSASDAKENQITQYLVSRFYRAPEIILGLDYDFAIDMWSIGCTLFELYTGKILFTGRSNNQMLRAIMDCRGKFNHRMLRKARFGGYHFDDLLNFRSVEKDGLSGKDTIRVLNLSRPTRDLRKRLISNVKGMDDTEMKELNLFVDLLDRCLHLNPEKRCTPAEALRHPFISRQKA